MNLEKRVEKLEAIVEKHLEESGEIRSDLKWLKKFMWALVSMPFVAEGLRHVWR